MPVQKLSEIVVRSDRSCSAVLVIMHRRQDPLSELIVVLPQARLQQRSWLQVPHGMECRYLSRVR
jgi:hypothetical protein